MPMNYARRKAYGKKKRYYKFKRMVKSGVSRAIRTSHKIKYFTEMVDLGGMAFNVGGNGGKLTFQLNQLNNFNSYVNLFDQFCVLRTDYIMLPTLGQYTLGTSPPPVRFVYALNRDPLSPVPSNEGQILSEDDCRIAVLSGKSKLKIRVKNPQPWNLQTSGDTNTVIGVHQPTKRWQWLSMNDAATVTGWYGVNYFATNPDVAASLPCQLYARITIAFKEQQ